MAEIEEPQNLRIHIANISPKLSENKDGLNTRLAKFGEVVKELEIFTKPLQDHYFGFITLKITPSSYDKLKGAFNGMLFMGMKLAVSIAKPSFEERLAKDLKRSDDKKSERIKRDKINAARQKRINEAHTSYSVNSVTGELLTSSGAISSPNQSALGYSVSSHTYNNASGNTKNKAPSSSLVGNKSYSAWTTPKNKPYAQQYSFTSGGSEVIPGRHRVTKRPNWVFLKKQQTLRILVNGELKTFKCYKTKLWGMEKNKTVNDLTWKYSNGVWKSGDDHVVERVSQRKVKIADSILGGPQAVECGINGDDAVSYGNEDNRAEGDLEDEEEDSLDAEKLKNKSVLASLFDKYDFEKPVEIEEDNNGIEKDDIIFDKKGRRRVVHYDYEIEGGENDSDSDDSLGNLDYSKANDIISSYTSNVSRPQEEVYYDEDDEGNELDLDALGKHYSTEAIVEQYNDEHGFEVVKANGEVETVEKVEEESVEEEQEEEQEQEKEEEEEKQQEVNDIEMEESSEDEFIPSFGQAPVTNNTETLRSLFNPGTGKNAKIALEEPASQFRLALSEDDEDIDNEKVVDAEQQKQLLEQIRKKQEEDALRERSTKYGLFWPHSDSPFLQTQSQLAKIGNIGDHIKLPGESDGATVKDGEESAYEKWFWGMRGELSRECKRRRRDVLRVFKKKSSRFTTT
ncbi:putative nucleolar protein required for 60S ribosome biogenesis [Scheffersomyces xylosifermentans]|uniref:putative nucleolar protein required for 60S ribosome biogenesis n=1 Tax=Scheffersomyces xylosifermentans TaxID=1304137 RepID=UPI00315CE421